MRTASRILFLLALVVAAGCATKSGGRFEPPETQVVVQNQAWMDMTVYVLDGARRVRLGLVGANGTSTFRIPDTVVGLGRPLRFQVDPVGSSNLASSFEINVRQGETVRLTIPPTAGR